MGKIIVQIIGAPVACKDGFKDSWRETSSWVSGQLHQRYGDKIHLQYYDLFDPTCPNLPSDAQLPVVLVNSELLSSGGKICVPDIHHKIENIMRQDSV